MLYSLIYYLLLFVCVFSILAIVVFARDKEHTTCRLAKQLLEDKTRVCVYVGANYTQWNNLSDIDNINKNSNNPSTFDKLFNGSIEEVALCL